MNKIAINLKKVPLIMGILNVTPDSFYDGGRYTTIDRALSHVQQMVKDGADIIDVGGESTRPGSSEVTIQEEMDRVCPIVERIIHEFNIPISIDTQKSKVADEVLKLGASIVNDISGLRNDNHMPDIIAKHDAYCIIMHIRGTPQTMQMNTTYSDLLFEIKEFLMESIAIAKKSNIDDHKIIIDPGIGFGKSLEQ
ncbi:MAG TPA: dihydropteroate synthase, partial [Spirochaetota bacterium]|nr:dihydropteroate synthase [Spirochaetota bacterium]